MPRVGGVLRGRGPDASCLVGWLRALEGEFRAGWSIWELVRKVKLERRGRGCPRTAPHHRDHALADAVKAKSTRYCVN